LTSDVDIVVNNAGVLIENSFPLNADAVSNLENEMRVNVYGLLHIAQAYAPILKQRESAVFCQINSVASMRVGAARVATYSASKAASYSLTQSLRMSLKETNVNVISVHPGTIATDMIVQAGFGHVAEPPAQVAQALIDAIEKGDVFHVYPDSKTKHWAKYMNALPHRWLKPVSPILIQKMRE
jgi:short-subunit dehydrogenase